MKGKAVKAFILILILILGMCQVIPHNVSAIGEIIVELRWDDGQDVQYADVEPGNSGLVTFTGTVSVDIQAGSAVQDVRIELRVSSEHGWDATITPEIVMLNPGTEEKQFMATIRVPTETSTTVDAIITVGGTAMPFPAGPADDETEIDPLYGTIIVDQYFRYEVASDPHYIEAEPGEEVQFKVTVRNEGNGKDQFEISVSNLDDLEKDDFEISVDPEMIEVPEKGSGTVVITVKTPEAGIGEFVNYEKNIDLNVRSKIDPEMNYQNYDLKVRVQNDDILDSVFNSSDFLIYIILIIVAAVVILFIWKRKKAKAELNNIELKK